MSYGICLLHIQVFEYKIKRGKGYATFDKKRERERLQREANNKRPKLNLQMLSVGLFSFLSRLVSKT